MRFWETPVHIPNTMVKTKAADDTILVTVCRVAGAFRRRYRALLLPLGRPALRPFRARRGDPPFPARRLAQLRLR